MMTASDQRSGFAASFEVRCFRESLGTKAIMRHRRAPVNGNLAFSSTI
jgi:hypothetical protein